LESNIEQKIASFGIHFCDIK